jgi:diketogulonate reductase-like aldo/keto reductase
MAAIKTVVVEEAFASPPARATGFDSVLVRLPSLDAGPAPGNGKIASPDGDEATVPRMVAVPLGLAGETPAETIAEALRARFGAHPLDCLILQQPVLLSDDWRANHVDHASKLLSAWEAMGRLVELGATRALGIAHAGEAVIDLLLQRGSIPPALNQIEFHPYLNSASLVRQCRDRGVAVHALRCLGPLDAPAHQVIRDPIVTELAQAHDRSPAEIILKWCASRVDGIVVDHPERALVGSPEAVSGFDLSREELASLDARHCGYRIDRSPSTLASIYGNLAAEPIQVRRVDTDQLEVGCHKVLYAPVTRSESFNRRFSFLVWRGVFNLPATIKHLVRPPRRSALSKRLAADLDRDGYALTNVRELGWEEGFRRLAAKASAIVEDHPEMRHGQRDFELGEEIEVPTALSAAIDSYFGLETFVDARYVVTHPGRLGVAGRRPLGVARRQQLWHSDSEDLITIKVYTFLTDVDAFSGGLEYIAESHPKGRFAVPVAELWKYSFVKDPTVEHTTQVPDDLLFMHVRPDLLRRLEGPAGTVVVFDARGLHRGGHVVGGVRQVAVSSHTAPIEAHPRRPPASRWSALWSRFQWQTNVKLREPEPEPAVRDDQPSRDGERSVTRRPPEPHPTRGGAEGSG